MEEIKLWKITREENEKPTAASVETIAKTDTEELLEEVLTGSPDLLMPNLRLIGRQTEISGGQLDLLGVDEDGELVVFELKRGNLTRDAVAQAIDYASYLDAFEADELCRHINENSGKGGTEAVEDFSRWYQEHFQRPVQDIGRPRVMLVGLGVDERAKRMVSFLAQCELDISLITFHGFKHGGETLLARQVEVPSGVESVKSTKRDNQAKLDKLLEALGIKQNYEEVTSAIKSGLGASAYQWPSPPGYSFYLPDVSATGRQTNRSYLALYAPEKLAGRIQVYLQPRAIEAAGEEILQQLANSMGSKFEAKPSGWGEIWIDGHKPAKSYAETLTSLCQAIAAGWKTKMDNQGKADEEAVGAA